MEEKTRSAINVGALFPSFVKERYLFVWNVKAYFDDSGLQDDTGVFVLGGWVATEKQWNRFEGEWQRALDEAEIDYFHATDFFNKLGKCNARGGRYEDWTPEKHLKFAKRFTAIAENPQHTEMGVGRGVDLTAYRDVILPESEFRKDTPHNRFTPKLFCAQTCLEYVAKRVGPVLPRGEKIAVIFESGRMGEVIDWCCWLQGRASWASCYCSFTVGSKSFLPLQAADLLAYETRKYITGHLRTNEYPLRKSFQRLNRGRRISISAGTRKQFLAGIELIKKSLATQEESC